MKYNPEIHHRKSIRLKEFDYSKQGMYFITICTQGRKFILSKIVGAHDCAHVELNNIGRIAEKEILRTRKINPNIEICKYVIMPNHIHMIININKEMQKTIGNVIRGIKSSVTTQIGNSIWQRNYYEHIIRNEEELYKIIKYIEHNPYNWINDLNYIKD